MRWPWQKTQELERAITLDLNTFGQWMNYNGAAYQYGLTQTWAGGTNAETIANDFCSYVRGAYQANGVVFACILARLQLFCEARFQWRQMTNGRPGDLFGSVELGLLEKPWPGGTTGDLLARAEQDVSLAGNFFAVRRPGRIKRMRPDWVDIVLGSEQDAETAADDIDAEPLGYIYWPGGRNSGASGQPFLREEVCHYAPVPDPEAHYRGMSWVQSVVSEIIADSAMTHHKSKFIDNGATSNMIITLDPTVRSDAFDAWVRKFKSGHEGVENAYKTIFLGGGADAKVVGANFQQMDFKIVQGAGETRIAMAAGVPPIVIGSSEGLASGTYSNYGQAMRRFADLTMRWLWRNFAKSVETIIPNPPPGAELWYDARDIAALQEDHKDAAEVQMQQATVMATLAKEGWDPDSVVSAVDAGDWKRLKHSGLLSVQLQPPGSETPPTPPALPPGNSGG